ncbi:MAG TPA: hypothetical protein VMT00_04240 [Thermoanaerobaculia bacterium]|nr:hypothetical protein [Thermoanaerobaculia bacterium]
MVVTSPEEPQLANIPLLFGIDLTKPGESLDRVQSLSPDQRRRTTLLVTAALEDRESVDEVEQIIDRLITSVRGTSPLRALGLRLANASPSIEGYGIKRLAVKSQGLGVADRLLVAPPAIASLAPLYQTGAQAYFDEILVASSLLEEAAAWLHEKDPAKRIAAIVGPREDGILYEGSAALAAGATIAFLTTRAANGAAIERFNREMAGDHAVDTAAGVEILDRSGRALDQEAIVFVRGEDLRSVIVVPDERESWRIASLAGDDFLDPKRVSATGASPLRDTGAKEGRFLIAIAPSDEPWFLTVGRPNLTDASITRETIEITTQRGISVEEIIRNHQAWHAHQKSIEPRYIAWNETKLRFGIGPGGDTIEATIGGELFSDPRGLSDWVWREFFINGVRWKYGRIPELPIIQPEKVTKIPLDIQLTNDYRYQLVGETNVRGHRVYEVRFDPPADAARDIPLYRGTVWIDTRNWARIRIAMVQLNLTGEILSNEERVDFTPFDSVTGAMVTAHEADQPSGSSLVWLPVAVGAQQVLSTAGRATVVLRSTDLSRFELHPETFDERHRQASASDHRMVRETEAGLRYLERTGDGQRVVKDGFDTARLFLLGGLHHDAGLEFPVVPLGGLDYFNFDLWNRGLQTNIFFAGVILAANLTDPSFRNSRTSVGADLFGIAIPFENSMYREGEEHRGETVKALPVKLTGRIGRPIFGFGKIDLAVELAHESYQRAEDTAVDFAIPSDTFVITPSLHLRYDRAGYSLAGSYERGERSTWTPWGDLGEYDESQRDFSRYGLSLSRAFFLPNFQRIGVELDYLGGTDLDRFSKYELGFFGASRVRGIQSGSVRAERAVMAHLSYGFVFSRQLRIEAFYDHALVDDRFSGIRREPFQGVGIGGQTIGPKGTILRFDLGKTVGRNAQDDFVANVIFLKIFG